MPHSDPTRRREYHAEYDRRRKKLGGAALAAEQAKWAKENPEKRHRIHRRSKLKTKYRMTVEEYEARFKEQDGRCAICLKTGTSFNGPLMAVDHCHVTGVIRGLLCGHCNSLLGYAKDRIEVLYSAIQYLQQHN